MVGTSRLYKRERNFEILRMRENGLTLREIGEKYGICRETVRQICMKARRVQRHDQEAEDAELG